MMRTASMRLEVSAQQAGALGRLRTAYTDACNRLVPIVGEHRLWNRVGLHQRAYRTLREATPLGSQMCCNAIGSVCKAYKSQSALGRIKKDGPVPPLRFDRASVHFDKRTYTLKHDTVSLNTLDGRITVAMRMGKHQRRMLAGGTPKEAEAAGIAVEYVNPTYTSQTCSCCGALGKRLKHRFECAHCGLRAHSDLNASRCAPASAAVLRCRGRP
jgi:hypothetical protein